MDELLAIYLRDHHAGASAGAALAKRAARNGAGLAHGDDLAEIARQIGDDRKTLERLMARLGVRPSAIKVAGARAGEVAGRLKLNGRLWQRSPLSNVVELETLALGIIGKRKLWEALAGIPGLDVTGGVDFVELDARARQQHDRVETIRREAAAAAFR
jgi:hypothetical protein